ncbi:ATP-dependent (S)-NAD(P)H-hydrate dehydratase [Pleurostoma richardsiae]|uniref:ATP-dependent (S)-NAD(P)H-hydrate dehydratase n=1 Tax=Pleurostoma richardsiae TaxID=41990 RepID=A0AA38W0H7_9PEZI|nr:ATP-dependent (S)-NAD(P)H-hydrate dehydratase [Pleurostoma richardsiae]
MPSESVTQAPEMSAATKEILARARQMVPPMLEKFHKGQLGRIAVIGGSEDYTGAPYFSAMSSARLGCDMSHVICTPAAATVIKSYSPNLMVHPLMRQSPSPTASLPGSEEDPAGASRTETDPAAISSRIIDMLPRLHVLVVGPGLGRDPLMHATVSRVITAAREAEMPFVLDADALQLVQKDPGLVRGYPLAVLTPNIVEFGRLCQALGIEDKAEEAERAGGETAKVEALARELGGVTVVQKGARDYISNGGRTETLVVDLEGGLKRSGGQGDTLTGSIATFLAWRRAYLDGIWDHGGKLDEGEMIGLAAFGGAAITRECSRLAFKKKGRSLQASDLTDEVHTSFLHLFGEYEPDTEGAKL